MVQISTAEYWAVNYVTGVSPELIAVSLVGKDGEEAVGIDLDADGAVLMACQLLEAYRAVKDDA